MPGLVKVGYTKKDPEERAAELNHTGSPFTYTVDYEILVDDPYQVEQSAHYRLSSCNEGKEWFRCSAENAIAAIKSVVTGTTYLEIYKKSDRQKAEKIAQLEQQKAANRAQIAKWKGAIDEQQRIAEEEKREHNAAKIQEIVQQHKEPPFLNYWVGLSVAVFVLLIIFNNPKTSFIQLLLSSAFFGALVAFFAKMFFTKSVYDSDRYKDALKEQERELKKVGQEFLAPTDLAPITFDNLSHEIRTNLAGRAGPKIVGGKPFLFGSIGNPNRSWFVTKIVLRVGEKNSSDKYKNYAVSLYVPPEKTTRFCTSLEVVPDEFVWSIQDAYGYH